MPHRQRFTHPRLVIASLVAAVGIALVGCAVAPEAAEAALRGAAGGADSAGGFARLVQFLDRLATYAIPVGVAFGVLGVIWGGILFITGDSRAGRVLAFVAIGVGLVMLAKPIVA